MSTPTRLRRDLYELARLYGIQRSFVDIRGDRRNASPEAVFLTLRALGAPIAAPGDVPGALRERQAQPAVAGLTPVSVAWDGRLPPLPLRLDGLRPGEYAQLTLRLESGEEHSWGAPLRPSPARHAPGGAGILRIEDSLPIGYHDLVVENGAAACRTRIISAPRQAHLPDTGTSWGVFAPLHAVRSVPDDGAGDYGDLEQLARWVGGHGGRYLGTLPLLPSFVDRPLEPSPYSPVSRLFWNEFYVRSPGREARAPGEADGLLDYGAVARARRRALAAAAAQFFAAGDSIATEDFRRFEAGRDRLADYARFRAVCDRRGAGWRAWPERLRGGDLQAGDWASEDERYYRYAQWQAELQLARIDRAGKDGAAGLYLDLPLGVHPDGYDAWRFRDLFAEGANVGAPPDTLFTGGQDWGFRPLVPDRLRATGYAYLIESLRHHLRHARLLRLDHVMSLFRLYWIPAGLAAREGVYVQYPANELAAVLLTESVRHGAGIVGEDLGTVPQLVRRALQRRGMLRIYVAQYECAADSDRPLNPVPHAAVASVNTHDMPPFASFLRAGDVEDQLDLGLIDRAEAEVARRARAELVRRLRSHFGVSDADDALLRALLRHLATSAARTVLISLEDLWLEQAPQNVPGTTSERPNWRRRFARTLEQLTTDPGIAAALAAVAACRRGVAHGAATSNQSPS